MARSGAGNRANYGSRSVTTSASVLVSANPSRQSATIQNVPRVEHSTWARLRAWWLAQRVPRVRVSS